MEYIYILKKALKDGKITIEQIKRLLEAEKEELLLLYEVADKIRGKYKKDKVILRGIIEFSNYCRKNCSYCGIRGENNINRYRMPIDEIMEAVHTIEKCNIPTVVLQSGEDLWWTPSRLIKLIENIRSQTQLEITLSIGERSREEYKLYKQAGADKFLLKIETTNNEIFEELHPDDSLINRRQSSNWLKELGYLNGSGCMTGLPGQTALDIAQDINFFKEMQMHMIGIGPFVPAEGTPLESHPSGDTEMTLKAIAVTRILCKHAYLPATTALETLHPNGQVAALKAGADVIMLNFTPDKYRGQYQIYNNKAKIDLEKAIQSIKEAGRVVDI